MEDISYKKVHQVIDAGISSWFVKGQQAVSL